MVRKKIRRLKLKLVIFFIRMFKIYIEVSFWDVRYGVLKTNYVLCYYI